MGVQRRELVTNLLTSFQASNPPMAMLQLFKGSGPGEELPLKGDRVILGRHPDCDVVLDAAAVSRQHAQILEENGQYYVEDLHSRNGTFVNGRLIQGRQVLEDGDRLKICDLSFTFHTAGPATGCHGADDDRARRWPRWS